MNMSTRQPRTRNRFILIGSLLLAGAVTASLAMTSLSRAASIETVTNLDDSGAGSLRQAVTDVDADGTIRFASTLSGTIPLESAIAIDKSLTIDGNGQVALSGRSYNQIFQIGEVTPAIDVAMDDLEITRGSSENGAGNTDDGCGIHSEVSGSLSFERMYFFRNLGVCIGAGFQHAGTGPVTVTDSEFARNSTDDNGGAIGMYGPDADLTVNDSEFRFNTGDDGGGAIFTDATSGDGLTSITDSLFINNAAPGDGDGGHIEHYTGAGDLTVESSLFIGGSAADDDGGVMNIDDIWDGSEITLRDVVMTGSVADEGGGIDFEAFQGSITMERVTMESTAGGEDCAGMELTGGPYTFRMEDSAIVNGLCGDSDSVFYDTASGDHRIINSTIAGNVGDGTAGAIFVQNATLLIDGSTIAGNQVASGTSDPGGIELGSPSDVTMRNSILADNLNGGVTELADCYQGGGTFTLEGANIIGDVGNCTFEAGSTTPITGDAGLKPEPVQVRSIPDGGSPWVVPLRKNSPAIDAAVGSDLTVDQRGVPRPQLTGVDIGAYEWAPTPVVKILKSTGTSMQVRVACGTSLKGCTLKVTGSRNLKGRVSPAEAKSVTVNLAAGQKKTLTIDYSAKLEKFVRRGVRKYGQVKIAANAVDTATRYKGQTTAKTRG